MAGENMKVRTLPTWEESESAVDSGEYTALHEFIFNWEPGDDQKDGSWRRDLAELIRDVFASGIEIGIEHQKKNTEPKNEQTN